MHKILIPVLLLAASATAAYIQDSAQQQDDAPQQQVEVHQKLDCTIGNWNFNCFLIRTIVNMRKMQQSKNVEIADGVTFVREKPVEVSERSLQVSEKEILNELPQGSSLQGTMKLTNMLYDVSTSFIKSHSLKFGMVAEHPVEEARTKVKKNYMVPLLVLIGTKVVMLLVGGLTVTAIKAFFISKIALLTALYMGFQKFFNMDSVNNVSGSSFNKNPQYGWYDNDAPANWVSTPSQLGYQNKRSVNNYADAHDLAYASYAKSNAGA